MSTSSVPAIPPSTFDQFEDTQRVFDEIAEDREETMMGKEIAALREAVRAKIDRVRIPFSSLVFSDVMTPIMELIVDSDIPKAHKKMLLAALARDMSRYAYLPETAAEEKSPDVTTTTLQAIVIYFEAYCRENNIDIGSITKIKHIPDTLKDHILFEFPRIFLEIASEKFGKTTEEFRAQHEIKDTVDGPNYLAIGLCIVFRHAGLKYGQVNEMLETHMAKRKSPTPHTTNSDS